MAKFIYKKGETTVDDIIEHILMRLNTDFTGGSLHVPDFCYLEEQHDYDRIMEIKVRDKMYQHNVAKRSTGKGQPDTAIILTAKGANVYEQGGWKKYLTYVKTQQEKLQQKSNHPSNSIVINAPVTGSQFGQSSDLARLDMKSKKDIKQIPIETPKKKSNQDIWEKLKSVAQILGFGAALIALLTKLLEIW